MTIVVDRASRELVGAAMACPDASAAIHECVLAIKARVTVDVLADTIHAFPSTSRIFNGLFADALRELERRAASSPAGLALEDDLAVHQHEARPRRRKSAARLDRVVERGGRDHHDVGALARDQAARGRSPAPPRAGVDARGAQRPIEGERLAPARTAPCPPATRIPRATASAMPGHGSTGSTGASVPNARTAPVRASDAQA